MDDSDFDLNPSFAPIDSNVNVNFTVSIVEWNLLHACYKTVHPFLATHCPLFQFKELMFSSSKKIYYTGHYPKCMKMEPCFSLVDNYCANLYDFEFLSKGL